MESYTLNGRKYFKIICPECKKERGMRSDAFIKRQSNMCRSCSVKHNKQLFKSSHGMDISHPIYKRWCAMKGRCNDKNKKKWYGNIEVCDEWKYYENFFHWSINNGFKSNLELDRIDETKNYSPDNCQYITHKENTLKIQDLFGRSKKEKALPQNTKIKCDCGSMTTKGHLARHKRTKKHITWVSSCNE